MKKFIIVAICLIYTTSAFAQFFGNAQARRLTTYHATVGTTTADAIPSASVGGNLMSFLICNDAVNTSTHLWVGQATDAATDGVMLGKGECFECPNCKEGILKAMRVKAQAATNGYSVIQYRQ